MIFPTLSDIWAPLLDILGYDLDYHSGHALESLYNDDENLKTLSQGSLRIL